MKKTTTLLAAAAMLASAWTAGAAVINLNPSYTPPAPLSSAFNAKYRISYNNFDMSIDNATTPLSPADQVTYNMGGLSALNGTALDFTLNHLQGKGYVLTIGNYSIAWGTGLIGTYNASAATLD
ncbi:MAG TPA: hypothetical protein VEC99_18535, partial [Clostridia bacterium]|nr:hypothetical protein [Clostridia bacterium]